MSFMRSRKKRRPSGPPQPIGQLMDAMFGSLKLDEPARAYRALRAFPRAAGPRIAARARAERMRGAVLFVRVVSSAWAQELHTWKEQIVEKLRRTPGGESVRDLRFSVGPLEDLPDWENLPEPPADPVREPLRPMPDAQLMEAIAGVRDPELREELSRLLIRA